jgi:Cu2+-exporting ATPase
MFRRLFWIMLVLAVPTVLFSEMFASIVGYALPDVPGLAAVAPVLGAVMYVWGGRPFLSGAVGEIRARQPGMMLLIGVPRILGGRVGLLSDELDFWWELALLIVIMLLGHWVEMRSLAQTSSALDSWRFRWWSRSPPSAPPGAVSSSRTGSPWSGCAPSTQCCSTRPAR